MTINDQRVKDLLKRQCADHQAIQRLELRRLCWKIVAIVGWAIATIIALSGCAGVLKVDPLPSQRPGAPYLCARSVIADVIVHSSTMPGLRFFMATSQTVCRMLGTEPEVYIGFEPTVGLHERPIYWTPIPIRPQDADCWFVEITSVELAIGAIHPCIERRPKDDA